MLTVALLMGERWCRFVRDVGALLAGTFPSLAPHAAEYVTLLHHRVQAAASQIDRCEEHPVCLLIDSLCCDVSVCALHFGVLLLMRPLCGLSRSMCAMMFKLQHKALLSMFHGRIKS